MSHEILGMLSDPRKLGALIWRWEKNTHLPESLLRTGRDKIASMAFAKFLARSSIIKGTVASSKDVI